MRWFFIQIVSMWCLYEKGLCVCLGEGGGATLRVYFFEIWKYAREKCPKSASEPSIYIYSQVPGPRFQVPR